MSEEAPKLGTPVYVWKDHSRFVELVPVRTGWLVAWGHAEDLGKRRMIHGARVYRTLPGARRRLADAVMELTGKWDEASAALALLDRRSLPPHQPEDLPTPL